ncbi:poly(A)-specific ribonuclease PARN isoform X1 [Microplitis demolitor]|uniref:poly(A)-specific ribonuclease PARN isoform X1 n=1 Tax=Microplitis demolitor TaxID=69319 RepID=UPI0004CC9F8E|nr:poly(A)-specific ribonuclease PARN isoform X1 [Microplitis demolitor]
MEVTRTNFQQVLSELDLVLKDATFLAIDGEFTGLNSGPDAKPFDTPSQYYKKLKSGSMDFLLVQFGLSVFTFDAQTNKYSQRSYNFYVFPRPLNRLAPDSRFMCQASSIIFLASQGFDFNKLFREGIPYLTTSDEDKLKNKLSDRQKAREDGLELIPISDDDKPQIEEICTKIQDFVNSYEEEITLNRCNAYIRRIIHQEVRLRWPNKIRVEGKVDGTTQGLVVYKMGSKDEEKKKENERREKEKDELQEAVGLSLLLRKIADSNKLIVGHNMLLDLCHIVHQFFGPLPDSYKEFKLLIHNLFPNLMDTKVLSQAPHFKDHIPSTVLNYMLESISKPPFSLPQIIPVENTSYTTNSETYHEAGFDAYITGLCFIAMANYLGSLEPTPVSTVLPGSDLLLPYINKLTMLRLKDFSYINLVGNDPQPTRNHVFHVIFPKEWKTSNLQQLFAPFGGAYISWLTDTTAYAGLNCREKVPILLKKLKKKNNRLGSAQISTYARHQELLDLPSSPKNAEEEKGEKGDRKRKQPPTESSKYWSLSNNQWDDNQPAVKNNDGNDGWEFVSGKRKRRNNEFGNDKKEEKQDNGSKPK